MARDYEARRANMLRARKILTEEKGMGTRKWTKKERKTQAPMTTSDDMIRAIKKVGPFKQAMADYLGVSRSVIQKGLYKRRCREALKFFLQAQEGLTDKAESTVAYCIRQRDDLKTASGTARWYLQSKDHARERGYTNTVQIEGGQNPIKIETTKLVDVDSLPLDLRVKLLESLDQPPKKKKLRLVRRKK